MKKIIHALYIIAFAIGCSGDQSVSTTSELIEAKDLNGLKTQKEDKLKTLNALMNGRIESNQCRHCGFGSLRKTGADFNV
jgi:hypothetical protein